MMPLRDGKVPRPIRQLLSHRCLLDEIAAAVVIVWVLVPDPGVGLPWETELDRHSRAKLYINCKIN